MMNQEDNFDDLIRQKFDEKEFVFNDENWEKAEKKIDAVRRLRKIYLWSSIFIVGLIIGIALTFLFVEKVNNENSKNSSEINPQKNNKAEIVKIETTDMNKSGIAITANNQNEHTVSPKEEEKENPVVEKSSSKTDDHQNTAADNHGQELSDENSQNISLASLNRVNKETTATKTISTKKETNSSTSVTTGVSNKSAKIVVAKTESPNKKIHENNLKTSEQPVNVISKKVKNNSIVRVEELQKNTSAPLLTESTQPSEANDKSQSVGTEGLIKKNETISNPAVNRTTQAENNSQKNKSDASLTQIIPEGKSNNDPLPNTTLSTQNSDLKNDSTANFVKTTDILQQLATEIVKQKSDSALQINLAAPPPVAPGGLASATFFSVDAGTNIEIGWKYADATEAQGFNPVLGLGITHYFNQKWSLYSGVQYGSIAYLKVSKKSFSDVTYGFGSTSIDTVIDTKMLHYAVVPIMCQYSLNDKNTISIGGSISYLVNSKSKVSINTTTVTAMATDSNGVSSTAKSELGYYANAFNKWDASIAFGYRRRISQKFNVVAIANFGLADIKNNEFFTRETYERNIGIKIVLSYSLFDF